jgi:hypothetical protein
MNYKTLHMIGTEMFDQLPDIDCEWKETAKGSHLCINSGEHVATVYNKGYGWQIIINSDGVGHIVVDEIFDDPEDAQERAEWILCGANCSLSVMGAKRRPGPTTTSWYELSKTSNGSPNHGRRHNGMDVIVKKATNDNWFYITYSGSITSMPDGWSESAEEAKRAFDIKHP